MNKTLMWLMVGCIAATAGAAEPERKTVTICGNNLKLMTGEEVKALGFPWVDVPDAENAATYYIQGANALYELRDDDNEWYNQFEYAIEHGWDKSMKALDERLNKAKAALDFYRKGASMDKCQLPYNKTPMLAGMLLPSLAKAREAARLLAADARRNEAGKKFKEAVDDYLAILKMAEHYGNARTLIDQLVAVACINIAAKVGADGICRYDYPKKELERLMRELDARRDRLPRFAHAMQSEKAFGLGSVDQIMDLGVTGARAMWAMGAPDAPEPSKLQARLTRILLPDQLMKKDMAEFYDRSIEAAKKPFYAKEAHVNPLKYTRPWNVFAQLMLPALGRARQSTVKGQAAYDMLGLVAALKIYRRKDGVWPDELGWLVQDKIIKAVPADPFSGKPYLYKLKGGDFVLYSVGPDMKDNGGDVGEGNKRGQSPDFGFDSKLAPARPYRKE